MKRFQDFKIWLSIVFVRLAIKVYPHKPEVVKFDPEVVKTYGDVFMDMARAGQSITRVDAKDFYKEPKKEAKS
jgi:hypothetical protein